MRKQRTIVVLGGALSGPTAAARARETDPDATIILLERAATISYAVYRLEADGVRDRSRKQLESSASLATRQVSLWHENRVRSMEQVAGNPYTGRAIAEWQRQRTKQLENQLREWLEAIRTSQDYGGVAAVAIDGTTILEVGGSIAVTTELRRIVRDATATDSVLSSWSTIARPDGLRP